MARLLKPVLLVLPLLLATASCRPKTREACIAKCDARARDDYAYCDKHPSQRNCGVAVSEAGRSCVSGCELEFPAPK